MKAAKKIQRPVSRRATHQAAVAQRPAGGSNLEVVLAALYLLGGAGRLVHVEDVALKAFELAPSRFSWTRFPKIPDLSVTRESLYDAYRANRRGTRLVRRTQKGTEWALTAEGVAFVHTDGKAWIEGRRLPGAAESARQEARRLVGEAHDHAAYKAYRRSGRIASVPRHQLADLLHVALDSEPAKVRERVEQYRAAARDAQDKALETFVTRAGQRLLDREGDER